MHRLEQPLAVAGYVLAGGRSSRMGRDKSLLELAARPLVQHAVTKLGRICSDVAILSNNREMEQFGRVVRDLHPDCGPMSGMEAALVDASAKGFEWSLVLPVDVPFVPTAMLRGWVEATLRHGARDGAREGTRVALFRVDGVPQPTLAMVHRDLSAGLSEALAAGRYKLFPELKAAAERASPGQQAVRLFEWTADSRFSAGESEPAGPAWAASTRAQEEASALYFVNLNTPEEFAEAERHLDVLDT